MNNPLKSIFTFRRSELPLALLMSGYFFLVITSFWILKPIKKSMFIQFYDEAGFDLGNWHLAATQAEQIAKVLNMVVAMVAVAVFTLLVRRFRRQQLSYIFTGFFMVCYLAFVTVIDRPGDLTVWGFYLFGDLFSTLMVATFFAFLNDSVTSDVAKRLYGLVGLGGVLGGVVGTTTVRGLIDSVSPSGWLWICGGLAILILAIAYAAGQKVSQMGMTAAVPKADPQKMEASGNPAFEGARLVFRSRYLLSIVAIVGLYEIVSTVMDFQFTSTISHYLSGPEIGRQLATVFSITNIVSLFVQLFLTSFVMTRFGVGTALMVLPLATLIGSCGFLAVPVLWMGSFLNTADNGFSYSINQSAKETLYVPTTAEEKYKAKAFIDMFVQRFAKVLAVGVSLTLSSVFTDFSSMRWLSVFTIVVILLWIVAARYAGRKFQEYEEGVK